MVDLHLRLKAETDTPEAILAQLRTALPPGASLEIDHEFYERALDLITSSILGEEKTE